jgi:hypothetical protein
MENIFDKILRLIRGKQDILESGTNIKTINGDPVIGSGNLTVTGTGVSDGNKGDITVSLSGSVWTIDDNKVTNDKINAVAGSKITTDSNHRLVSDTEKSTWNAKQNALGFNPVPDTRTITINGVTQDLTTNRTYNIPAADGYTTIVKSASQDVTNAGLTIDTELQFNVIAGGHYMVDMDISLSANNTTGDYIFDFEVSSGTMTGKGTCQTLTSTGAISNIIVTAAAATSTTDISTGSATATLDDILTARVLFSFTATANSTFRYKFGNNTPGAGRTSRTWKGSVMRYKSLD